eukprot:Plantae.Rhodophyta-Rhodochaete_pulchella.ctg23046.p3 GENE.Plantae.Rhodophyta-Rhodochaete_pulchella.ctg23046~~Plantae.Rhodophyta-Rhodochaete_pulchella.ctg23046.p3  ORF type:complete len:106 (+),score=17.50 Plantae.Rhodophyta-Rhodochaete_pulchella.ctg23046:359-676(+)
MELYRSTTGGTDKTGNSRRAAPLKCMEAVNFVKELPKFSQKYSGVKPRPMGQATKALSGSADILEGDENKENEDASVTEKRVMGAKRKKEMGANADDGRHQRKAF